MYWILAMFVFFTFVAVLEIDLERGVIRRFVKYVCRALENE